MSSNYSLEQIQHFLLTEHPAVHGISPDVYEQNTLFNQLITLGSEQHAPGILGCQVIGSRAHGYAALDSDIDMAIIAYRNERRVADEFGGRLLRALLPSGVGVDWYVAPVLQGIRSVLPTDPSEFIGRVSQEPIRAIGLYEAGVYDTPGLRLGALAASEIIKTLADPQEAWTKVRLKHADTYLGQRERICTKLAKRLKMPKTKVLTAINTELWQERIHKFALPERFDDHYETQRVWLETQNVPALHARSLSLYEQVALAVRR